MQKAKIKNMKQNNTSRIEVYTLEKGITLIALIITIIVMLILVGVTINVAINGGLFSNAENSTYKTEASLVKEQLEIAKVLAVANNGGKALDDYSGITVASLTDLDQSTINKYKDKILVNTNGDICYNPETVTNKEKLWLEEIGIIKYVTEDLTSTIWAQRGVTSGNVKFDTLYYVTLMDSEDFQTGMTFGLYSNGDFCIHLKENTTATTVSKKDENGNNTTGSNGATTDVVGQAITADVIRTFSNGFTVPFGDKGHDMTIRYTSENTVEVYMATPDERTEEDGTIPDHVPEDEKYRVATLIPQ